MLTWNYVVYVSMKSYLMKSDCCIAKVFVCACPDFFWDIMWKPKLKKNISYYDLNKKTPTKMIIFNVCMLWYVNDRIDNDTLGRTNKPLPKKSAHQNGDYFSFAKVFMSLTNYYFSCEIRALKKIRLEHLSFNVCSCFNMIYSYSDTIKK